MTSSKLLTKGTVLSEVFCLLSEFSSKHKVNITHSVTLRSWHNVGFSILLKKSSRIENAQSVEIDLSAAKLLLIIFLLCDAT